MLNYDIKAAQARAQSDHVTAPETLQDLDRETYGFESLKTSTTQAAAKVAMGLGIQAPKDAVWRWESDDPEAKDYGTIGPDAKSIFSPTVPVAINPKEIAGSKKPSVWSVMPRWIVLQVGRVMSVGAAKYGAFNYRESPIAASTYQDALERHLGLWFDGEDNDHETGVSHLASAIASCTLLMDAQATGKLVDDRQKTGLFRKHLDALEALLVTLPLPSTKVH